MHMISSLSLFLCLPLSSLANLHEPGNDTWSSERRTLRPYSVDTAKPDPRLKATQAALDLNFTTRTGLTITEKIKLSYNGTEKTVQPNKLGKYSLTLKPGKYKFQFWYNDQHKEIFTDSIAVPAQNRVGITTHFQSSAEQVICFKPVIYLYPTHSTQVNVKLDLPGAFDFTYPAYPEKGWQVTAHADGALEQNGKVYNYLFWEGPTVISQQDTDKKEGFVVESKDLTFFFEDKLTQLGLNTKEIQDYITYWVPRLQEQPRHFIRFLLNEDFDKYAPLTITPRPDQLLRVFMLSTPLNAGEDLTVKPQTLPAFKREGFTAIEWGGTVVPLDLTMTK